MVAAKNQSARKRALLLHEMGLVKRDGKAFTVKSPTRGKESSVWRDDSGKIRCSCEQFQEQVSEDANFRCEHILAVKYHLEVTGAETDVPEETVPIEEEEKMKSLTAENVTTVETPVEETNFHSFPALLKELSAPIPKELVRQRVGWTDSAGIEHEIDYIEWHTVADLLDRVYPAWAHSVKEIRQIGDIIAITASITIFGVTREGVGTGSALDEKGIKKAEHDALKRAAVKFGVARELYKKDDEDDNISHIHKSHPFPKDPIAKTLGDLATPKQLGAIKAIANNQGLDAAIECQELLRCKLEELSRRAASVLIDHLKAKTPVTAQGNTNESRRVS